VPEPLHHPKRSPSQDLDPFVFGISMAPQEVEISDDVFAITAETADAYKQSLSAPPKQVGSGNHRPDEGGGG
jgi:hypothetical protein